MMMVRCGGSATRTVIEECISLIFGSQIQHIHIAVPDGLIGVLVLCDYKMVREYRVRVYKDMIFLALASLKLHHYLLCRPVLTTEEAPSFSNVLL